jgi:hypothetical protein
VPDFRHGKCLDLVQCCSLHGALAVVVLPGDEIVAKTNASVSLEVSLFDRRLAFIVTGCGRVSIRAVDGFSVGHRHIVGIGEGIQRLGVGRGDIAKWSSRLDTLRVVRQVYVDTARV